jgi:dienelactone hydrolase
LKPPPSLSSPPSPFFTGPRAHPVSAPQAANPAGNSAHAIVLCTDIFGYELPNVRQLALQLSAAAGVDVYVPDIIGGGDALAPEFDRELLGPWFGRHGDEQTMPLVARALAALRAAGKVRLMTLGFCWGARYALLAACGAEPLADAFGVAHPTKTAPQDYVGASVPGLFLLAETDGMFPAPAVEQTKALLEGKGHFVFKGPWAGTSHGFVVRGDDSVPEVQKAREEARAAAATFYKELAAAWAEADASGHGHSHGGAACGGHSHGGGHSHAAPAAPAASGGGHSHGGKECGGHSHAGGGGGCAVA